MIDANDNKYRTESTLGLEVGGSMGRLDSSFASFVNSHETL